MNLYVHAGFHKTGTTAFQSTLLRNAVAGASPIGVYVRRNNQNLKEIQAAVTSSRSAPTDRVKNRIRNNLVALRGEILGAGHATAIISMESLCGGMPDHRPGQHIYPHANTLLKMVADVFVLENPTFFFSKRHVADWIVSVHSHRVRTRGASMPLKKFSSGEKYTNIDFDEIVEQALAGIDAPYQTIAMEDDLEKPLGPGSGFLNIMFPDGEAYAHWERDPRINKGLHKDALNLALKPWMRVLPGVIRKRLVVKYSNMLESKQ